MENFQNGSKLLGINASSMLVGLNLIANGMHYSSDTLNHIIELDNSY